MDAKKAGGKWFEPIVSRQEINLTLVFVPWTVEIIRYGRTGTAENEMGNMEESAAPPAQTQFSVNLRLTLDI